MAEGFIFRAADILLRPTVFFRRTRDGTLMQALVFFFTLLCLHSLLAGIVIRGGGGGFFCSVPFISTTPAGAHSTIAAITGSFLFTILQVGAMGAAIHLTAVALGAKNGMQETFRAVLYGVTPALIIGWIPLTGLVTIIWSLGITIIGVRELQEISTVRAIVAICIPATLIVAICSFIIAPILFGYDYSGLLKLPCP